MTSLPEGASDLYGLPPSEFVAQRNALVRELKRAKRTDDAGVVAALRRPSVADHAINAAGRADPDLALRWSVAVIAVAEAQQAAISGGSPGALRETAAALRSVTAAVAEAAVAATGDETKRNDILGALRAATTRPGAALVAAGILGAADPEDELFAGAVEPIGSAPADRSATAPTHKQSEPTPAAPTRQRSERSPAARTRQRSERTPAAAAGAAATPVRTPSGGTRRPSRASPAAEATVMPDRPPTGVAARRDAARAEAAQRRVAATERAAARVATAAATESATRDELDAARHAVDAAQDALRVAESGLLTAQRAFKRAIAASAAARAAATRATRE